MAPSNQTGLGTPPKEDLYRADFNADLEVRDATEGPVLTGHFSKFNEWTEINSSYEGRFMERVAPGAFAKTISESVSKMRVLFNHGKDVLGQQILGPIRSLKEDNLGAAYEVPLFDGIPPLILAGLRAGQYGSSFRFGVEREEYVSKPRKSDYNPLGIPERTIKEARVREFGPVTFGAYAGATAGVRSITDDVLFTSLTANPDQLRSMIAEEVAKNNRVTVSLSGTKFVREEPEPSEVTTRSERVDAEDIDCLAQMLSLGACFITEQDEDTPEEAAAAASMTTILTSLTALLPAELAEDEPMEPDEMNSAPPEGEAAQDGHLNQGRRHRNRDLFWFASTPTHL